MRKIGGRRARRGVLGGLVATGLIAAGVITGVPAASGQSGGDGLGDLPISPEWLANTLGHATDIGSVKNNTIPGAIERVVTPPSRSGRPR